MKFFEINEIQVYQTQKTYKIPNLYHFSSQLFCFTNSPSHIMHIVNELSRNEIDGNSYQNDTYYQKHDQVTHTDLGLKLALPLQMEFFARNRTNLQRCRQTQW